MKRIIRKYIPDTWLKYYRYLKSTKNKNKFGKLELNNVFLSIYKENHWKGTDSISGTGSNLKQTEDLRQSIPLLFKQLNIKSILDIPCGDFYWMKEIDLTGINYIGADIVSDLITGNREYSSENISFRVLDLTKDELPKSDLIICRDCLVHLSFKDIYLAINNIISSGCKYLLTTSFTSCELNYNIVTGDWRVLNLEKYPFNFPKPLLTMNENCTEANGNYSDKAMLLWEINKMEPPKKMYKKRIFVKV